jgi:general secretion pathway protein I
MRDVRDNVTADGARALQRRAPRRVRAFTLMEVLVALIIVSLGMLGVIQAVGQTASNGSYLRDKTMAHWVAMNRLTEVRLQKSAPKVDKTSDEVEMAGRKWRWTMNVTQTPVESIRRIDISVRPSEADPKSSLASITGFYGTAIAPPGTMLISWQGPDQRGRRPGEEQPEPGEPPPDTPRDQPPAEPPEQPSDPDPNEPEAGEE